MPPPPGWRRLTPRLPGQSFAIEHRVQEKFRLFLCADVDNLRCFVPFVLKASGRLGTAAVAFLERLRTLCHFPILRFRTLVSVIFSVKYNARIALRWVRYLRRPI